jgi:pimeloyl-ACP methyl ester carboxylesterase
VEERTRNSVGRHFRSPDLANAFSAAYDGLLARWPQPVERLDVPGPYGTTRVYACGPEQEPPVVLLHGHGCTSAIWFANVATMAQDHRVLAFDAVGDAGYSMPAGERIRTLGDFMAWLDGVLDSLGVSAASFCGHSYGAWLALSYALHARNRVSRLILLDPTDCFASMSLTYRLRAVPLLLRPSAERARRVIQWESRGIDFDAEVLALMCLGGGEFRGSRIVLSKRPREDLLAALDVPTLLLLAEHSRAHDINRVQAAASRLLPGLNVAVLAGASHHSIPATAPRQLNGELQRFLAGAE